MYRLFWKRVFDIIIAASGIIIFLPLFVVIAVLIKLDSPGTILFKQIRSGKDKKPFYIIKFRTMDQNAPKYIASKDSGYFKKHATYFQKFLRKSSIDELPQLINILKGDMSVIGPRPVIREERNLINEREKYGANSIRPGLTGWAQINGRDKLSYKEKARLDGEYIKKMNIQFDLKCSFLTIRKVFSHEGFNDFIE